MMGLPYSDLLLMSEHEFNLYRAGHQKQEIAEWERTRFVAWMIQATQSTKPLKIEEVMPLPTDKERKEAQSKLKKSVKVSKKKFDHVLNRLGLNK